MSTENQILKDTLDLVAPAEKKAQESAIAELENFIFTDLFLLDELHTTEVLSLSNKLDEVMKAAVRLLKKSDGLDTEAITLMVRNEVKVALSPLSDVLISVGSNTPPEQKNLSELDLHRFFEYTVRFFFTLSEFRELKKKATNPIQIEEQQKKLLSTFNTLQNFSTALLIPEFKAKVENWKSYFKDDLDPVSKIDAPTIPEGKLSPEEMSDLSTLSGISITKDDFFDVLLNKVTAHKLAPTAEKLPSALVTALTEIQKKLKEKESLADILPATYDDIPSLGKIGSTGERRGKQLLDVVTSILELNDAANPDAEVEEHVTGWKNVLGAVLIGSLPIGAYLATVKSKLDSNPDHFSDEDVDNLKKALVDIQNYKNNIRSTRYAAPPSNPNFNEQVYQQQEAATQQEIDRIASLLGTVEANKTKARPDILIAPETAERRALEVYEALRSNFNNQGLPEANRIHEMAPQVFMSELQRAMTKYMLAVVNDVTRTEGGNFPAVTGTSDMWSDDKTLVTSSKDYSTLKFLFLNFPWRLLLPGHSEKTLTEVRQYIHDKYLERVVHFTSNLNMAHELNINENDLQLGDNMGAIITKFQNGPGFDNNYTYGAGKRFVDATKPELRTALIELFGGEEDVNWHLLNLEMIFEQETAETAFSSSKVYPHTKRDHTKNLPQTLDRAKSKIPQWFKDEHPELVSLASVTAQWKDLNLFKVFRMDNEAIGSKFARLFNAGGLRSYLVKLWPTFLETGERANFSTAISTEKLFLDLDQFRTCLAKIPKGTGWEEVDIDTFFADAIAQKETDPYLYESYLDLRKRSGVIDPDDKKREAIKSTDTAAIKRSISKRYAIIRVNPSHTAFGLQGRLIFIPRAWLRHADDNGYSDYLPMTLEQSKQALVDREHIDPNSITANQTTIIPGFYNNFSYTFYKKVAIDSGITPIHDPKLQSELVRRKPGLIFDGPMDVTLKTKIAGLRNYNSWTTALHTIADFESLDQRLRSLVSIGQISQDWLVAEKEDDKNVGFNMAIIIKNMIKYGLMGFDSMGWQYPTFDAAGNAIQDVDGKPIRENAHIMNQLEHIFRSDSTLNIQELLEKGGYNKRPRSKNLFKRALSFFGIGNDSLNPVQASAKDIRKYLSLPISNGFRAAVDLYDEALKIEATNQKYAEKLRKKAQNTMNQELFMVVIRAYLDRYTYQGFIEKDTLKLSGNLERDYKIAKVVSGKGLEPMSFIERELLLKFSSAFFKNVQGAGDVAPDKIYDETHILHEMKKRGIIGSRFQLVVDAYALKKGGKMDALKGEIEKDSKK